MFWLKVKTLCVAGVVLLALVGAVVYLLHLQRQEARLNNAYQDIRHVVDGFIEKYGSNQDHDLTVELGQLAAIQKKVEGAKPAFEGYPDYVKKAWDLAKKVQFLVFERNFAAANPPARSESGRKAR